ncbi:MAG: glycosyl hydrolase [Mangrovibacterium sp.]
MIKNLFLLFVGILAFTGCKQQAKTLLPEPTQAELERNFVNPPVWAKPHTWWHWMNGNIFKEGITADLEAMASAGIGGAQIFNVDYRIPHGKVRVNSPEWFDMVKFAVAEAKRLGLEICLHNCAGWSSSGGPWNTPENSMKIVVTSEIKVKGPGKLASLPPQPEANLDFYRDIAVLAFPSPVNDSLSKTAIEDLDNKIFLSRGNIRAEEKEINPENVIKKNEIVVIKDGTWDIPEGDWTIFRVGYTSNGRKNNPAPEEATGLECDKLSKEAVKAHWDGHIGLILDAIGKIDGPDRPGFNNVLIDSYEVGSQNWTQGFEKEFNKRCGYDIIPFLPVFTGRIVESPEITERFLWDFRKVVADLFAECYSGYFGELAHKAGLLYSSEPYGNCPSNDIQYGSYADIPMGEFWPGMNVMKVKLAASIAHVYQKKFVGAEAFTTMPDYGRWQKDPYALKPYGDSVYCGGINRMIFHCYTHQPWTNPTRYPGMTMGRFGTHFERTQTWWNLVKDWLTYQTRCQYMLQEGRFVADALYWCGEDAPNGMPVSKLPQGYDYDGCDTRAIEMLKVKDGNLVLPSGMTYRILVLPDNSAMSPETLKIIEKLVKKGAKVVGRTKPVRAQGLRGYPASDKEIKRLADKIWPKIISGKSPGEAMKSLNVLPDFMTNKSGINYIHRIINGIDVYFVACSNPKGEDAVCTFRVAGKVSELWRPDTGGMETAAVYSGKDSLTTVPIRFDPYGSVFVVFRKPVAGDPITDAQFTADQSTPRYIADDIIPVPAYVWRPGKEGNPEIEAWEKGVFELKTAAGKVLEKKIDDLPEPVEIQGPWELSFPPDWGAPEKVILEKLISWTAHPNDGVKYFSGTATYFKQFTWNEKRADDMRLVLDLGNLKNFAETELNGKPLLLLWKPPYRLDITDVIRSGENTLTVKITNLWPNRLIGDEQLPDDRKWNGLYLKEWPQWVLNGQPSPTGRFTFTTWHLWTKDDKPLPSGLFGPVLIRTVKRVGI